MCLDGLTNLQNTIVRPSNNKIIVTCIYRSWSIFVTPRTTLNPEPTMLRSDSEDSLTTINTALNKSMVLMDSPANCETRVKGSKSIKISTKVQPPFLPGTTPETARKSILKKSRSHEMSDIEDSSDVRSSDDATVQRTQSITSHMPRPHNLEDFLKEDSVIMGPTHSTFSLEDLSDNEELWVMDIPKTVNPRKLRGQTLSLGEKSKLKIDDERYCAVSRDNGGCLTWVFSTGKDRKPYKAVNIKPTGTITVRRKLQGIPKAAAESTSCTAVPSFPSNLKVRHPFFGPSCDKESGTQRSRKSRKEAKSKQRSL